MQRIAQYVDRPGVLDLGWGHPHPDLLPVEAWSRATADTLRTYGGEALSYGHEPGPDPLREWLVDHLAGTDAGTTAVAGTNLAGTFVTAGASHALDLVAQELTRPGDSVLVDAPTYHLALRILADRGLRIVPVPADADGPDPDAVPGLADAVRRDGGRISLLYLVATFNNPTGRSLPADRRAALVGAAQRAGLTIVEDDTYRELAYGGASPASLWSHAEPGTVVRIGSFAKTVAPGLRLGWLNAAPELVDRLSRRGYVDSGGGVNHTTALTMATFGTSGAYAEHLGRTRPRYAEQRDALVGALRAALPDLAVPVPDGGWFVWLPLPPGVGAAELLTSAERFEVSFVDGNRFRPDGRGSDDHIRLSFSMLGPAELTDAAGRLARAINNSRD